MPQYVVKRTLEVKLVLNFARKTRDWVILSYYRLLTPKSVRQLYNIFSNHPQGAMIISELDAYRLYRHVRVNRFSKCLEFGAGIGTSSAFIAAAMQHNAKGSVVSLEQLPEMVKTAETLIPEPYKSRIQIIHSDVQLETYFERQWSCYLQNDVGEGFDFVIVDGPMFSNKEKIIYPNGDLIKLLPNLKTGCSIYIDGRVETRNLLISNFPGVLEIKGGWRGMPLLTKI